MCVATCICHVLWLILEIETITFNICLLNIIEDEELVTLSIEPYCFRGCRYNDLKRRQKIVIEM